MQLGDFEVACGAEKSPTGRFIGTAHVVWVAGGETHTQDWTFKGHPCDNAAEAIMVAEGRIAQLFVDGRLGGSHQ